MTIRYCWLHVSLWIQLSHEPWRIATITRTTPHVPAYVTRASAFRGSTTHYALLREGRERGGGGGRDWHYDQYEWTCTCNEYLSVPRVFSIEYRDTRRFVSPLKTCHGSIIFMMINCRINNIKIDFVDPGARSRGDNREGTREDAKKKKKTYQFLLGL